MSSSGSPLRAVGGTVLAGLVATALVVGGGSLVVAWDPVNEGNVGVVEEWGAVTGQQVSPGAHWRLPVKENIRMVEVRPRTYTMSAVGGEGKKSGDDSVSVPTQDGVTVNVDVTVRYRVDADRAAQFVSDWNTVEQAEMRLIRPTVRSELRNEGGGIPTSDIYTEDGRELLRSAVHEALVDEFETAALVLEAVQIREVHLPDSYARSVEEKEIKKQEAQQEAYEVDKAEEAKKRRVVEAEAAAEEKRLDAQAEANATRIRAEAQAEANRKIAASIDNELINYEFVKSLSEGDEVYWFGNGGGQQQPFIVQSTDDLRDRHTNSTDTSS